MLKSKTLNKIIAAAAALTLWAYVITVENPTQIRMVGDVSVQFANLDVLEGRNLTVASDVAYSVEVSAEGKRVDVAKLSTEDFIATVDLLGWQKGEQIIPIEVRGPETVTIVEKRPAKLMITIEDLISVSKPIRIEYTEAFPEGREPGFINIAPDEIEISGAKSQIDDIAYISVMLES
jgi:YbbR domain-containing protein